MSDAYDTITEVGTVLIWDASDPEQKKNRFLSHHQAEQHYDSCILSNFQLNDLVGQLNDVVGRYRALYGDIPGVPNTPPLPPGSYTPPGEQQRYSRDGTIWKPIPEEPRVNPVLVLEKKYCAPSKSGMRVTMRDRNGAVLEEKLQFTGCANGDRANHRVTIGRATDLVAHAPLYLTWTYLGQPQWLVVPNPTQRYD